MTPPPTATRTRAAAAVPDFSLASRRDENTAPPAAGAFDDVYATKVDDDTHAADRAADRASEGSPAATPADETTTRPTEATASPTDATTTDLATSEAATDPTSDPGNNSALDPVLIPVALTDAQAIAAAALPAQVLPQVTGQTASPAPEQPVASESTAPAPLALAAATTPAADPASPWVTNLASISADAASPTQPLAGQVDGEDALLTAEVTTGLTGTPSAPGSDAVAQPTAPLLDSSTYVTPRPDTTAPNAPSPDSSVTSSTTAPVADAELNSGDTTSGQDATGEDHTGSQPNTPPTAATARPDPTAAASTTAGAAVGGTAITGQRASTAPTQTGTPASQVAHRIAEEINRADAQVAAQNTGRVQRLTMRLSPEGLGDVSLTFRSTGDTLTVSVRSTTALDSAEIQKLVESVTTKTVAVSSSSTDTDRPGSDTSQDTSQTGAQTSGQQSGRSTQHQQHENRGPQAWTPQPARSTAIPSTATDGTTTSAVPATADAPTSQRSRSVDVRM